MHDDECPTLRPQASPVVKGIRSRPLVVALATLVPLACLEQPNQVERDIQSVQDRTVPHGGHLISGESARRKGQALWASWQVESNMPWEAYGGWIKTQLSEFRLARSEADSLRFSRSLDGDVYYVTLKRSPRQGHLLVDVTFQAEPF